MAYNDARYCAVGLDGSIATSTDATTWTNPTSPTGYELDAITASGTTFVAVGANPDSAVFESTDCSTWTSASLPLPTGVTGLSMTDVTYGNGLYVAVGFSKGTPSLPYIATSPDGAAWTMRDPQLPTGITGYLDAVSYGAGRFVALGWDEDSPRNYYLTTSTDGITWTAGTAPTGTLYDVVFHDGQFVAVGYSIWTSPDGLSWTQVASVNQLFGIAYGAGQYVAVGYSGQILSSTDGTTWTPSTSASARSLHGVVFDSDAPRFVAVGSSTMAYADQPTLSIANTSATEGDSGTTPITFTVTLSSNGTLTLSPAKKDSVKADSTTTDGASPPK